MAQFLKGSDHLFFNNRKTWGKKYQFWGLLNILSLREWKSQVIQFFGTEQQNNKNIVEDTVNWLSYYYD